MNTSGVRLLDLVEQHDPKRPAAHGLRELAAVFEPDVARGRAYEPGHRVLLHVLRHVDADHVLLVVEQVLCESAGQLGLPHAGGPQEDKAADGPVRVLEGGPRPPYGVGYGPDRRVLSYHPLVQPLLHVQELLRLALQQTVDGGYRSTLR